MLVGPAVLCYAYALLCISCRMGFTVRIIDIYRVRSI